ncbi:hypothetical protein [Parabacteroides sp. PH5-8]|uniref:hypothetical protein n=1 Tax=unclassified Parabacteroides TaxID=2649774 RepID=UPI0032AF5825
MNELLKTKLFNLLVEPSQESANQEMKSAYESFMEQLRKIVSQPETDYSEVFRMLNITRIELVSIKTLHQYGQGEKCPETCLYPKSISLC